MLDDRTTTEHNIWESISSEKRREIELDFLLGLVRDKFLTEEQAAERFGTSVAQIKRTLEARPALPRLEPLATTKTGVNREVADRLYKIVVDNPERPEWALEVFNALHNTNYDDKTLLARTTIDDAVFMGTKNDASFLVMNTMCFCEQHSTIEPNMPMLMFLYSAQVYHKLVEEEKRDLRCGVLQRFPFPRFVCFFNGRRAAPRQWQLHLRDSFINTFDLPPELDLTVNVYNINEGHFPPILEGCRPLKDYARYIALARELSDYYGSFAKGVDAAVDRLPDDNILKLYIQKNRAEVTMKCLKEFDEETHWQNVRDATWGEAWDKAWGEAWDEAWGKSKLETLTSLVKQGLITPQQAADQAGMTIPQFEQSVAALS